MKCFLKINLWLFISFILSTTIQAGENQLGRVAHAGGSLNGISYSNSIDALNNNIGKYKLFELDLNTTSDGYVVCIHDWNQAALKNFGYIFKDNVPDLKTFEDAVKKNTVQKNCTFRTLNEFLRLNKDATIITDVKSNNIYCLEFLSKKIDDYSNRFIVQIYQPEEYEQAKRLGYKKIIWTLYNYYGSSEDVLMHARKMKLFAITMPKSRAEVGLALMLKKEIGLESYVHTVNTNEEFDKFIKLGISEIYTDIL